MRALYWEDFVYFCSQHLSHIIKVCGGIPLGFIQGEGKGKRAFTCNYSVMTGKLLTVRMHMHKNAKVVTNLHSSYNKFTTYNESIWDNHLDFNLSKHSQCKHVY